MSICTLAKAYDGKDPTGRLLSEKLDGVRALWDGERFVSRNDKPFYAPEWYKDKLPPEPLDGELWIGRGLFQKTVSAVRKHNPVDLEWSEIKYAVFDLPKYDAPFVERLRRLTLILAGTHTNYVFPVAHVECLGSQHLEDYLRHVLSMGGEGVMLREPTMPYAKGRTGMLQKLKVAKQDEAEVIGYVPGGGKYEGMMGALKCKWKYGTFQIGTGFVDADRDSPPPVGSVVTFNYANLTDGKVPRHPVFVSVRDYE